uniref:U68-Liphistoxin-Lsp1a_1 n=1 Tax=Liphistius sp. SGP-2016 TaxID=1905180 RepID=A0A4Q8K539_9ARAC
MKIALAFIVLSVTFVTGHAALTCKFEESKCGPDECCVKIGPGAMCKKLKQADDRCEVKENTHLLHKHMYMMMCPCAEGLKCVGKENLLGKFMGTCQVESEEVVEPDTKEEEE